SRVARQGSGPRAAGPNHRSHGAQCQPGCELPTRNAAGCSRAAQSHTRALTPGGEGAFCNAEHYNYFRDYDPAIGRYIESDPIGLAGGLNTFAYVYLQPLELADRDGRVA